MDKDQRQQRKGTAVLPPSPEDMNRRKTGKAPQHIKYRRKDKQKTESEGPKTNKSYRRRGRKQGKPKKTE